MADSQVFNVIVDFIAKNKDLLEKAKKGAVELTAEQAASIDALHKLKRADEDEAKAFIKNTKLKARELKALARENLATLKIMKDAADDWDRAVFKPLATGGALLVGGIFAAASKYVNDAKVATSTTIAWKKAQDDLNKSGERIGAVLAKEALPLLKEAAVVTAQIAKFLEANPGAAGAALKGGLLALTIGTIGKAVTSGIRLYADLKLDAAPELQLAAAKLQLQAAQGQLSASGVKSATAGAAPVAGAGGGLLIGVGVLAGFGVGKALDAGLEKIQIRLEGLGTAGKLIAKPFEFFTTLVLGLISPLYSASKGLEKIKSIAQSLGIGGDGGKTIDAVASGGVSPFGENRRKIAQAFNDWKTEDAKLVRDEMTQRIEITKDGAAQLVSIGASYSARVSSIGAQAASAAASIRSRFNSENEKAETQYANDRAEIIRDGNQSILDIEQKHQEDLEQLTKDHNIRVRDFTNARDALGLARENEAFRNAVDESGQGVSREIAERKRETAQRLQELQIQFTQERAERQKQFAEDIKQNAINTAAQLKEAAIQYAAEQKQAREAQAQKLRELQEATNAERLKRREAVNATIRDLQVSLGGEQTVRKQYYNAIVADAANFSQRLRSALSLGTASGGTASSVSTSSSTTTSTPATTSFWGNLFGTKDTGGYVGKSIQRMAWNGNPEFVLNNNTTRAMEKMVGGKLTQDNIMQARGGAVTLNDSRRFSGEYTQSMRREIQRDTEATIGRVLKGAL